MKYLIVVDMQKDFVSGCLGTEAAMAIVKPMAEYVKGFDGKVIFTRDTHQPDYLSTAEGKKLPVVHCVENTDGWEIVEELKPYVNKAINKPTFGSVDLAWLLCEENKNEAIEEITLIGVCTSICVISNALVIKAHLPEVKISVMADLCACVSEESHNAALKAMETAQIDIVR